jgi:hypothetical protein
MNNRATAGCRRGVALQYLLMYGTAGDPIVNDLRRFLSHNGERLVTFFGPPNLTVKEIWLKKVQISLRGMKFAYKNIGGQKSHHACERNRLIITREEIVLPVTTWRMDSWSYGLYFPSYGRSWHSWAGVSCDLATSAARPAHESSP